MKRRDLRLFFFPSCHCIAFKVFLWPLWKHKLLFFFFLILIKVFVCRKALVPIVFCMWKHCAQVTGSAAWIFISIALNGALTFQGSNNFQHKAFCFQHRAIPLGLYILVARYSKCGLLFHCVRVCVLGNATHSDCAVVYTPRRRCSLQPVPAFQRQKQRAQPYAATS